jgi:hypothetical protein
MSLGQPLARFRTTQFFEQENKRLIRSPGRVPKAHLTAGLFPVQRRDRLVELVSIGPSAPAALLTSIATNGATAFLIIVAVTFG